MTEKEKSVYSKLYDMSMENLQKNGMTMTTAKETMMASLTLEPDKTDLSIMYDIPRDIYIQVLFYITFRRWVADDEIAKMDIKNLDDETFRKALLKSVFDSTERRIKKSVVYNYIDYSNEYTFTIGRFKRRFRMTITKIKARIPLKFKKKVKDIILKILHR